MRKLQYRHNNYYTFIIIIIYIFEIINIQQIMATRKIIVGITGTNGAGKGTVVERLMNKYQFKHYSVRNYLLSIMEKNGVNNNDRNAMRDTANKLRAEHSPSYIVEQLLNQALLNGNNDVDEQQQMSIIESIRVPKEAIALKEKGQGSFYLLAVDADPKVRYQRILQRQSETDNVTYLEFLEQEDAEMVNVEDHKQNLKKCIEISDAIIYNDQTIDDLNIQIDQFVDSIQHPTISDL